MTGLPENGWTSEGMEKWLSERGQFFDGVEAAARAFVENLNLEMKKTASVQAHNARVEGVLRKAYSLGLLNSDGMSSLEISRVMYAAGKHDDGKLEVKAADYFSGHLGNDERVRIFGHHSYDGAKKIADPLVRGIILFHHPVGPLFAPKDFLNNTVITPNQNKLVHMGTEWLVVADRMVSMLLEERPYNPLRGNMNKRVVMDWLAKEYAAYQTEGVNLTGQYVNIDGFGKMIQEMKQER